MTQFMLVKSEPEVEPPEGVRLRPIRDDDDFLQSVARHWDAQQSRRAILVLPFVVLVSDLVRSGVEFVCWTGSDYRDLPVARKWDEVEAQLCSQTAAQPADLFLHFRAVA